MYLYVFICFGDIQPSRYALSYVPSNNIRDGSMKVAFVALDSENLGEHVNDNYHHDFGDNMFPHFLGNKTKLKISLTKKIAEDDAIARSQLLTLVQYIPKSVLKFLIE